MVLPQGRASSIRNLRKPTWPLGGFQGAIKRNPSSKTSPNSQAAGSNTPSWSLQPNPLFKNGGLANVYIPPLMTSLGGSFQLPSQGAWDEVVGLEELACDLIHVNSWRRERTSQRWSGLLLLARSEHAAAPETCVDFLAGVPFKIKLRNDVAPGTCVVPQ